MYIVLLVSKISRCEKVEVQFGPPLPSPPLQTSKMKCRAKIFNGTNRYHADVPCNTFSQDNYFSRVTNTCFLTPFLFIQTEFGPMLKILTFQRKMKKYQCAREFIQVEEQVKGVLVLFFSVIILERMKYFIEEVLTLSVHVRINFAYRISP